MTDEEIKAERDRLAAKVSPYPLLWGQHTSSMKDAAREVADVYLGPLVARIAELERQVARLQATTTTQHQTIATTSRNFAGAVAEAERRGYKRATADVVAYMQHDSRSARLIRESIEDLCHVGAAGKDGG